MKKWFAALTLFAIGSLVRAQDGDSVEVETNKLQGFYRVIRSVDAGKEIPQEGMPPTLVVFDGNLVQVRDEEKDPDKTINLFSFKPVPGMDPKAIDFSLLRGPRAGKVDQGIYRLEGKTLTICIQEDPKEGRPKTFESKEGTKLKLIVLKKVS